jgi:hypothetical protein
MALLGPRKELDTLIDFFMNETATRGVCVSVSTGGSGIALDQGEALATVAASSSGVAPLGILLNDMVNLDLTRQHVNQHKDEVQQGSKVTILNRGEVTTDDIFGTPSPGDVAYCYASGLISPSSESATEFTSPTIGRFHSSKDENGYAKVSVNLP